MSQPDSAGVWVSDTGNVAHVYQFPEDSGLHADVYKDGLDVANVLGLDRLREYGNDWQKREIEPYKDTRPPKPGLALVERLIAELGQTWAALDTEAGWVITVPEGCTYRCGDVRVVLHLDNDPEIVAAINKYHAENK